MRFRRCGRSCSHYAWPWRPRPPPGRPAGRGPRAPLRPAAAVSRSPEPGPSTRWPSAGRRNSRRAIPASRDRRPGRRRGQGDHRRPGRRRGHRHGLPRDRPGRDRQGSPGPGRGQGRGRRHDQREESVPRRDPQPRPQEGGVRRDLDPEGRHDLGRASRQERPTPIHVYHPLRRLRRRGDVGRLPRRTAGGPGRRRRLRRPGTRRGRPPRSPWHRLQQRQFRLRRENVEARRRARDLPHRPRRERARRPVRRRSTPRATTSSGPSPRTSILRPPARDLYFVVKGQPGAAAPRGVPRLGPYRRPEICRRDGLYRRRPGPHCLRPGRPPRPPPEKK